jgi:uncharacterized repeat protein (TIGR03803 family)
MGTVFQLAPPVAAGGDWTESLLYSFHGGSDDGATPIGIAIDKSGNLYGVTESGGLNTDVHCKPFGCGTLFQLSPPAEASAAWTYAVLHFFNYGTGSDPSGTPLVDGLGIYGTASDGGEFGWGVIYRMIPPAAQSAPWQYKILYRFKGYSTDPFDGNAPVAGLTLRRGILYGTTVRGGAADNGTVFALVPPTTGGTWTEQVLHSFAGATDGLYPYGQVILDKVGNLYGTTLLGGSSQTCSDDTCGIVFQLTAPATQGAEWTETILHSFSGKDGAQPGDGLFLGSNGVLYGVTPSWGKGNEGVVYGVVK